MIQGISDTISTAATTAGSGVQAGDAAKLSRSTPFGEVLIDEAAAPDFRALFGGSQASSATANSSPAAATAGQSTSADASSLVPAAVRALVAPGAALNQNGGLTAESLFGTDIFLKNPSGHGGYHVWNYNPAYFATRQTADIVAKMLGGIVIERNDICSGAGGLFQDQPNEMVQLPNGKLVNAGIVADIFNHESCQVMQNKLLQEAVEEAYDPSAV